MAAATGEARTLRRRQRRWADRTLVTGLVLLLALVAAAAAGTSAPAEEAPASSMLRRRRQLDDTATLTAADDEAPLLLKEEEEDVETIDGMQEWTAAFEGEGDKGWLHGGGGGGQPKWPFCAWEGTLTRNISNIFALENTAAYHFLAPWMKFQLGAGVPTFRISGTYPRTAFFDFASYSRGYIKAIDAIADYQIKPSWGKNPFAEPCTPEEVGSYEVYVTLHGDKGYPNEIRLLKNASDAAARSYLTPVIMRFYGMDPTMDRHDFEARVWGGVRPPKVEYLEGDGRWVEVPQCTEEQRAFPARVIERVYGLAQGIDTTRLPGRLSYRGDCPTRSIGNGLVPGMLLHGGAYDVIPVSFQNPHSVYAYWCMSPHVKQIQREEFFIKLKARLPIIPRALFEGSPRIYERHAYDSRFISITTMDLNVPHRVYDSISGIEIEDFYYARQGPAWDRRFTIVAGLTQEGVDACGMLDRGSEIWLNWNKGDDASLHQFRVPHITYRDILSAVDTVPRKGRTATDVARTCIAQEGAWNDCDNFHYVSHVMQDYYPMVEIWKCDRTTGKAEMLGFQE